MKTHKHINGKSVLFFTFIFLMCSISLVSQQNTYGTNIQPITNDSLFKVDSIKAYRIYRLAWDQLNNGETYHEVMQEGIAITENLLKYKKDSLILVINYFGKFVQDEYKIFSGRSEEGIEGCMKTLALFEDEFGENHYIATVFHNMLSDGYNHIGDYERALLLYKKNLKIRREMVESGTIYPNAYGNLCLNVGRNYERMGELNMTILYYKKAFDSYQEFAPQGTPFAAINIGRAYLKQENYDKALFWFRESIRWNDPQSPYYQYAQMDCLLNLTKTFFLMKKKEAAVKKLEEAVAFFNESKKEEVYFLYAQTCSTIAELELQRDSFTKAYDWALRALEYISEVKNTLSHSSEVDSRLQIAEVMEKTGDTENALTQCEKSIHYLTNNSGELDYLKNPPKEHIYISNRFFRVLALKSRLLSKLATANSWEQFAPVTEETISLATDLADQLLFNQKDESSRLAFSNELKLFYSNAITFYSIQYVKHPDSELLEKIFFFMEKSKAATLKLGLQKKEMVSEGRAPKEMVTRTNILRSNISALEKLIYDERRSEDGPDEKKIDLYNEQILDYNLALDAIRTESKEKYQDYYYAKFYDQVPEIADVQTFISEKEIVFEYFISTEKVYLMRIDKHNAQLQQFEKDELFDNHLQVVIDFNKQTPTANNTLKSFEAYTFASNALYNKLFTPLDLSAAPKIIIIPDGKLGYLTFETLLTETPLQAMLEQQDYRNLPYALQQHSFRYEYSTDILLRNKTQTSSKNEYVGFAPQYVDNEQLAFRGGDTSMLNNLYPDISRNGLTGLKFNQSEISQVSTFFKGASFLGQQALESTFKKVAPEKGILHLAMHALTNDINPRYSQLVFSEEQDTTEDGILYAYELYNTNLKANLAVLSACDTGAGKLRNGEGIMSLARAFKYAGCPNIVMSLWKANDQSTSEMMIDYFGRLNDGEGKGTALQKTKLNFLSTCEQRYTHPYYWATFVLIGDDEGIGGGWSLTLKALVAIFSIIVFMLFYKLMK